MRWALLLVASAGCRQLLGLEQGDLVDDATIPIDDQGMPDADAPAGGHDEDGDGVVDTIDNCPTVSNVSQVRTPSSESVGAACDPRVAALGDRIAAFYSFAENVRPAGIQGGDTFAQDRATLDGGELATQMSYTPSRIAFILSNTTIASGNEYLELRLGTYFCRIGECSGSGVRCLRASGSAAVDETEVEIATSFRLEMDQIDDLIVCRYATVNVETMTMALALTSESDKARIRSNGAVVSIDSFVVYDVVP